MTDTSVANASTTDKVMEELFRSDQFRSQFFDKPEKIDQLVRCASDLQRLYEQSCDLFDLDKVAALKLMFHIYFQTQSGFGMHHVFDAIGLNMDNAMNDEVCGYIKEQWERCLPMLSEDDKAWWRRECAAWRCVLPS
jgi:hypothetical protein